MGDAVIDETVAVLGTGRMGTEYVRRLCAAGRPVYIWNRTPQRAEPLARLGATIASTPAEAIAAATLVVVALEHSAAFRDVVLAPASLRAFSTGHLVVDMSTTMPADARAHAAALAAVGCGFVDVPVSGGVLGAAHGTLTLLGGGAAGDLERASATLARLGQLHRLGPVGAGQAAKLANQTIVALSIAAVSEGLHLGEAAGLDLNALIEALMGGFADSRVLREHGARMARGDFIAGATNRVFLKDLDAIAALAAAMGVILPATSKVHEAYAELVMSGRSEADHSSYIEFVRSLDRPAIRAHIDG